MDSVCLPAIILTFAVASITTAFLITITVYCELRKYKYPVIKQIVQCDCAKRSIEKTQDKSDIDEEVELFELIA